MKELINRLKITSFAIKTGQDIALGCESALMDESVHLIKLQSKRILELESALMAIKYNSICGKEFSEINTETLENCLIILNK